MQKWEYIVKSFSADYGGLNALTNEINGVLAKAGAQGWELFDIYFDSQMLAGTGTLGKKSHTAIVTLKRPRQPDASQDAAPQKAVQRRS